MQNKTIDTSPHSCVVMTPSMGHDMHSRSVVTLVSTGGGGWMADL